MNEQPIALEWTGDSFVPVNAHWQRRADEMFVVGERYALVEHHERSAQSHRHYFAQLHDLWLNLPEHLSAQFPNAEVLRKHALIAKGYCDKRSIVCRSEKEAERMAAFVAPIDAYAIVTHEAATVTIWTAQSQNHRAMGKKAFQESKSDVLEWCANLIGVSADDVQRNAA